MEEHLYKANWLYSRLTRVLYVLKRFSWLKDLFRKACYSVLKSASAIGNLFLIYEYYFRKWFWSSQHKNKVIQQVGTPFDERIKEVDQHGFKEAIRAKHSFFHRQNSSNTFGRIQSVWTINVFLFSRTTTATVHQHELILTKHWKCYWCSQ